MALTQIIPLLAIGGDTPLIMGEGWRIVEAADLDEALAALSSAPFGAEPDLRIPHETADDIPAVLAAWRPQPLPPGYDRIEATFGSETVGAMALRLCVVLTEAMDALGTPNAADAAHKVAGVAGTLGFADLGQQWLAVSHDPLSEPSSLRRMTRTTIAAIVLRTVTEA